MAKGSLKQRFGRLKPKKKANRASLPPEVLEHRELLRLERKLTKQWATQNAHFDTGNYVKQWDDNRDKFKKIFERIIIKYLSIANGAQEANETIRYGMKMGEAGIDLSNLQQILIKMMKIEVQNELAKNLNLDDPQYEQIMASVIQREFPVKVGQPIPINVPVHDKLVQPLNDLKRKSK